MNKRQKQVEEAKLAAEAYELRQLKAIYNKAAEDIANKIEISNGTINFYLKNFDELDEVQKSIVQSQIYQKQFQESLQKQINGYLSALNAQQYKSIDEYLNKCYKTGYIGSMYDIAGQGIPVISPIDQKKVTRAMVHNSPISEGLYAKLGVDTTVLKKRIANNIARGISTASDYRTIARNINLTANIGFNKAMRIARTEGHRIQCEAALDAQYAAKAAGADIVKQWDAALDANTRETHRMLDGQIRELDEPFEVDGMQAMNPAGFGIASEDINCRCALLQRARWAMDADELEVLRERAAAHGLYIDKDNLNAFRAYKEQTFVDFQSKYLKAAEIFTEVATEAATKVATEFVPAKTIAEAEEYAKRFVVSSKYAGEGSVSFKGMHIDVVNEINKELTMLFEQNNLPEFRNIGVMNFRQNRWKDAVDAPMAYRNHVFSGELYFNPRILKSEKTILKYAKDGEEAMKTCFELYDKMTPAHKALVDRVKAAGNRQLVAEGVAKTTKEQIKTYLDHEVGHHIHHQILGKNKEELQAIIDNMDKYGSKLSAYATTTVGEYIAESYCAYMNGWQNRIDPALKKMFDVLRKAGELK